MRNYNKKQQEGDDLGSFRNQITETVLNRGLYINPNSSKYKEKCNFQELKGYVLSWKSKMKSYQKFLQLISALTQKAQSNKDLVKLLRDENFWKNFLKEDFESWVHVLNSARSVYEKFSDDFFNQEKEINRIPQKMLQLALGVASDSINSGKGLTEVLQTIEGGILPHYFKLPNEPVIKWITHNIDQKKQGLELDSPKILLEVLEKTKNAVYLEMNKRGSILRID